MFVTVGGDPLPSGKLATHAKDGVARLINGQTKFFDRAQAEDKPSHRCATLADGSANSGVVPPLTVTCGLGPQGKCVPSDNPHELWEYVTARWKNNGVFSSLGFSMDAPHRFHYSVLAENSAGTRPDYGGCQFTAQAFGDLDADSEFSTFERVAHGDGERMQRGSGIYIDKEFE